jgi:hypothetical protein
MEPGSQAQVDLGYVGQMMNPATGKLRKTWAFIMTLSYSQHRFDCFIFRQDLRNWIDCHRRAFEFLGGIPATVAIDNLKTGVLKADLCDPTLNRAYAEMEQHYGFIVDPTKIAAPLHKGKVERGVPVVRKHLLAGRNFRHIEEAKKEIGMEVHGTTRKPWEVFVREERLCLSLFRLNPLNAKNERSVQSIRIITLYLRDLTILSPAVALARRCEFEETKSWFRSSWKGNESRPM